MHKLAYFSAASTLFAASLCAQSAPAVAGSFATGLQLDAEIAMWHQDADAAHYRRVVEAVNQRVDKDGKLTLKPGEDEIDFARAILLVCRVSKYKPQYFAAAKQIHDDLVARTEPLSPQQVFAAVPFRVQYDVTFADTGDISAAVSSLQPATKVAANDRMWLAAGIVDTLEALPPANAHSAPLRAQLALLDQGPSSTGSAIDGETVAIGYYERLKAVRLGYLAANREPQLMPNTGSVKLAANGLSAKDAAFALAQSEVSQAGSASTFRDANVTIDAWFNAQTRTTPAGNTELFHYKWNDEADSGYSFFGRAFQRYGAKLTTLAEEPTVQNLAASQVYVIVSPDIPAKNSHPHYVAPQDVEAITKWVANGGVLLLLHNDSANTEFEHFNTLTERFGIHYNPVLKNPVEGNQWVQAQVPIPAKTTTVFQDAHLAYMKDIDTISTQPPAHPVLRDTLHGTGDVYMAVSHFGKGVVFATVDPWLYNEYTDGQKLGGYSVVRFDPFPAAIDLARWALSQSRH